MAFAVVVVVVCCTSVLSKHPAHQHNIEVPHRLTIKFVKLKNTWCGQYTLLVQTMA